MSLLRHGVIGLLMLLLGACVPMATSVRPDQIRFAPLEFSIPVVEPILLPNGIRLYLREDHELPLVEITAMAGVGAIADPADKTGLAGLFAATLQTGGAGDFSAEAFDRHLEQIAADFAVIADTYTLSLDLSLRRADLGEGLKLLDAVLRRPGLDAHRFELARRQAVEQVRRQDDQPGSVASRALMRALYGDHPLGRTPTVASLEAISREDLLRLQQQSMRPDQLWLGVTGDFDRAELLQCLTEIFGDWQAAGRANSPIPPLAPAPSAALWLAQKNIPQTTILFGEIGIDKDNPDLQALRVMNFILGGGGFNSRLMREIRSNRGLAYSVYSYFRVGRLLPGPFIAGCETKSGATGEVVALMRQIMREMRQRPVSAEELQLAKDSLINSFVFAFTDTHQIVTQQMRIDYFHYPQDYLQTYQEKIAAVTVADVLRVARDYLHPDEQNLVLVGASADFEVPVESFGLPVKTVVQQSHP
ncbi:MAG: pitrilysin family protein [Desulfuromonadaceae bacterium]